MVAGLVVDSSALAKEVEIRGETLDLPPIRLSLTPEIKRLSPGESASVDLREHIFRWTPIPNTATYQINFSLDDNTDFGALHRVTSLATIKTTSTGLCLGMLKPAELSILPQNLIRGRTGIWRVSAYDAKNHLIGETYHDARFVVANGLAEASE